MRASKMFHSYEELKLQKIEEIEEENGQDFILIVNENQLEARMMGSYLANFGYKFKDVSNGFEALNIIKTTPPLLVISSIKIEGLQGSELCQILKLNPKTSSIPIMLVSSSDSTPDKTIGFQQGCDDYITKPLDLNVLKNRVDSLLKRSRQLPEDKLELTLSQEESKSDDKMDRSKIGISEAVADLRDKIKTPEAVFEIEVSSGKKQSLEKSTLHKEEIEANQEELIKKSLEVFRTEMGMTLLDKKDASKTIDEIKSFKEKDIKTKIITETTPRSVPSSQTNDSINDERGSFKYQELSTEKKLKAEASLKLNLPTRKQISQADVTELYGMGEEIVRELERNKGEFGPEEFLAISTYCEKLAEEATANNNLLSMALSKDTQPTLGIHGTNCAIIAMRTGTNLQMQAGDLPLLGMAAMLHDLGMIKINTDIYRKQTELSASEKAEMHNHVKYGMELIEKAIKKEFPQECKYISTAIWHHHEREEGQGYPQKLTGDQISRSGKIVGVVDTYEALCHRRFHRTRQTTYRALQEVVGMKKTMFDPIILRALVNELTFFPIGCYVRLNTDEIGVVIDTSQLHSMRPKVKIITGPNGSIVDEHRVVDLVEAPFLYVVKPLEDEDIPELNHK